MEQLSPLDTAFLDVEDADRHASLAIASIAVLEGPPPSQEEFVANIGARIRSIPRARQKVRRVPWDLGLPVWVDDPHFESGYHFRRTALPAPGDEAALHRLVGRIMSQRLDRDRPLWESWVIEGLAGDRWAVLTKVHHCLADGVSGAQLYGVIFSDSPRPEADIPYHTTQSSPEPGTARLLLGAIGELARTPLEQAGLLLGAVRSPARLAHRLAATTKGLAALAGVLRPVTPSSLSGEIGQQRRYGVARASFAEHGPFGPVSLAIRLATRLPQHSITTVTTNVPGPREPLYVLGRKMVELLPFVPIAIRLRIGLAALTYCDQMVFGITTDYDSASEVDLLAEAIEQGIAELVEAARSAKSTVDG